MNVSLDLFGILDPFVNYKNFKEGKKVKKKTVLRISFIFSQSGSGSSDPFREITNPNPDPDPAPNPT